MKPKSPSSKLVNILQASRKPADAAFVDALKQKLLAQAAFTLPRESVSGLALIVQSMKRYSLAYVAGLLLLAMGVLIAIPKGINPEDFLAKASESYESSEGIFHEKRLSQRFENGVVVEASLEEVWIDEANEQFLHLVKNPDTEEILEVMLEVLDPNTGERKSYESSDLANMSTEQLAWIEAYSGTKIECVKIYENESSRSSAFLKVATDDFNIYTIDGITEVLNKEEAQEENDSIATLVSGTASPSVVKDLLNNVQASNSPQERAYKENGFFVFEWHITDRDGDGDHQRTAYYFFDLETYALTSMKLTFEDEPNRYDLTTYLHETLDYSEGPAIFNPTLYNVTETYAINAGGSYAYTEEGCYIEGLKLNEIDEKTVLESLPTEALERWMMLYEDMILNRENEEPEGGAEPSASNDFFNTLSDMPFTEATNFSLTLPTALMVPTDGAITQAYHSGHTGIDFANKNQPDVWAAAEGTVVYISEDDWDGGHGNNIWIDHGEGYYTHYAHLDSITVELGQTVNRGDIIGVMGNTGRVYGTTGIVLHFEFVSGGMKVDPSPYFIQE